MAHDLGLLTQSEIATLPDGHPLRAIVHARADDQVAANTLLAARQLQREDSDWLIALKPRLLDIKDATHASSALGELRAYSSLRDTWMTVKPAPIIAGSRARPEFEVDGGDGPVIVEVHARQLEGRQSKALQTHRADLSAAHAEKVRQAREAGRNGNMVTSGMISVTPFGAPQPGKAGDTVATNVISRLASIKLKEHQIDPGKPFVLWLDLQDPTVWGATISDVHFSPMYTEAKDGEVAPGNFWFAVYGRKGDPLLVSKGFDYATLPLAHDGRFNQAVNGGPSRVSAYVFSLPRATVLLENPNAPVPLPPRFRAAILKAPFFRLDVSMMEWKPGLVAATVEVQRQGLLAAAQALQSFDPLGEA